MALFQKILVAYDGSSHSHKALTKALEFMKKDGKVETHVLTVTQPPSMDLYGGDLGDIVQQELDKKAELTLAKAKESTGDYQDACHFEWRRGYVPKQIIDYADEHNIDLIILGSRGLGTFKEMMLGSVSHHVSQHATCQVLIIR